MLASNKAIFHEGHRRIVEIRNAIDQAHNKRCEHTDPTQLVQETERNISNKERSIERCSNKIADLKAQRAEIDESIAAEEGKLRAEQVLLDSFRQRLEMAKVRQQESASPLGVLPAVLDKDVGQPTLRK